MSLADAQHDACRPLPVEERGALFVDPPLGAVAAEGVALHPPPFIFGEVGNPAEACAAKGGAISATPPSPKSAAAAAATAAAVDNDPFALSVPLMMNVREDASNSVSSYVPMHEAVRNTGNVTGGRVAFARWLATMKEHMQAGPTYLPRVHAQLEAARRAPPATRHDAARIARLEELVRRSEMPPTVVCMNTGSFVFVTPEEERQFLELYAGALSVGARMWAVERTTPVVRMFIDLDFVQLGAIGPHVMIAVAATVQRVMRRMFSGREDVAGRLSVELETGVCAPPVSDTPPPRRRPIPSSEAEAEAYIRGMPLSEYLRCIVCTTDYQDKGPVPPDIASAAAARRAGGKQFDPHAARYIKSGCHIIWPNLMPDGEMALQVRANVLYELIRTFGMRRPQLGQNTWHEVVDHRVYTTLGKKGCGLRMIGSRKVEPCPVCKGGSEPPPPKYAIVQGGGKRKLAEAESPPPPAGARRICTGPRCTKCLDEGRVDTGRPYMPLCVLDGWGRRDVVAEAAYRADLYLLIQDTKMRTPLKRALPSCGFRLTPECITTETLPPEMMESTNGGSGSAKDAGGGSRKKAAAGGASTCGAGGGGGGSSSSSSKRGPAGSKINILMSDARWGVLETLIRTAFGGVYTHVVITNITSDERVTAYLVNVMGVQYCHNVRRPHTRNRVYFKVTSVGVEQRCYSEKMGGDESCKTYSTSPQPLPAPVVTALFALPHELARETEARATLFKSGVGARAAASACAATSSSSSSRKRAPPSSTGALLTSTAAAADAAAMGLAAPPPPPPRHPLPHVHEGDSELQHEDDVRASVDTLAAAGSVHALRVTGVSGLNASAADRLSAACRVATDTMRAMATLTNGSGGALSQLIGRMSMTPPPHTSSTLSCASASHASDASDGGGGGSRMSFMVGDTRMQELMAAADSLSRSAYGVDYSSSTLGNSCGGGEGFALPSYMRVDPCAVGPRELDALMAVGLAPPPPQAMQATPPAVNAGGSDGGSNNTPTALAAAAVRPPWYEAATRTRVTRGMSQSERTNLMFTALTCAVDAAASLPPARVHAAATAAAHVEGGGMTLRTFLKEWEREARAG